MLRKAFAVLGLFSLMMLASPAGALGIFGGYQTSHDSSGQYSPSGWYGGTWGFSLLGSGLGSWDTSSYGDGHNPYGGDGFRFSSWRNWSGWHCDRPGNPIPEPGAALLFGVGALLVSRRLRRR